MATHIEQLFEAQQANRWNIAGTDAAERKARLRRFREALIRRRTELCEAVYRDFRRPTAETEFVEVLPTLEELNFALEHLETWMHAEPVGAPLVLVDTRSEVRPEPRGVVVIFAPWNYPILLTLTPLIAAVAAGNCVVVKPSEKSAHTSRALAALVAEVFPAKEVGVLEGGPAVAEALLQLPFDHFFFTGSQAIGKKVMAAAASHLASVTLELGGKSPAIVETSANIETTAERLVWGKFVNAGQTCVAPDFVLVRREVEQKLLGALVQCVERAYGRTTEARKQSPDFARLIDDAAFARLNATLNSTLTAGAKVVLGGSTDAGERYLEPTVLTNVTRDAPIMQAEIFGPILPVLPFDDEADAVRYLRCFSKPLALYIFAADARVVERYLARTTAGGTVVNHCVVHFGNPHLPLGGVGQSGVGAYHGRHGFETFSHRRSVLRQLGPSATAFASPPYDSPLAKAALWTWKRMT